MKDQGKTKEQLIQELELLHLRIEQLEAEQEVSSYYDDLHIGINNVDIKGNFTSVNKRFLEVSGYSKEEIIGKNAFKLGLFPSDSLKLLLERMGDRLSGKPPRYLEIQFKCKNGRLVWVELAGRLLKKYGVPVGFQISTRDINDRKKAEEALNQSEEKYRTLVEAANDVIVLTDLNGKHLFRNNAYYTSLGYEIGADSLLEAYSRVHPDDLSVVKGALIEAFEKGESISEYRVQHRDGHWMYRQAKVVPIYDFNKKPEAFLLIIRDITERKRAENLFLDMFNNCTVGMYIVQEGKFKFLNTHFVKLGGYADKAEVLDTYSITWVYPEDQEMVRKNTIAMLKGQRQDSYEYRYFAKNGEIRWAAESVTSIQYESKRATLGSLIDVTALKRAEEALHLSEKRLKEAQSLGKLGYWEFDLENQNIEWSDEVFKLYERDKRLGSPTKEEEASYYSTEQVKKLREYAKLAIKTGEECKYDLTARLPSGKTVYFNVSVSPIKNDKGNVIKLFGTVQDVTERKLMEVEQQRLQKLESVGLLAGGIAHDFNNILTAILGNASLASIKLNRNDEVKIIIQEVEKAAIRAKDLTQQLLTFAKGGLPVKKLMPIGQLIMDTAQFNLRGSNVRCLFSISDDLWQADIDEGQISQVISNLVINARQAMPTGGNLEIHAENIALMHKRRLGMSLPLEPGDYIRITVIDHGIGIPRQHLDKIFDPYFTTKQTGSGLGLATSYSIIRNHGGHISVQSEVNVGSTFYIYLPASKHKIKVNKEEDKIKLPSAKGKILVMDDEVFVRDIVGRMLREIGYEEVEFAADGEEAIKLFMVAIKAGKPFALVILDLTIPGGMGGKETMEKLLKIDPEVKAIVSSGYTDERIMSDFKQYGIKGIITKPYTIEQFSNVLYDVLS